MIDKKKLLEQMTEEDKELLYIITKTIAENDSIRNGLIYIQDYSRDYFDDEINDIVKGYLTDMNYVYEAGIDGYLRVKKYLQDLYNIS